MSTATTSLGEKLQREEMLAHEKRCCLVATQPSVLPAFRGRSFVPEPGHEGVLTCSTRPSPASFQASIPLLWPPEQLSLFPQSAGSR